MQKAFDDWELYASTDSSYSDEIDHGWSTMGQFLMMGGGPTHQKSYECKAKINRDDPNGLFASSVMRSTVEAEYVALSNGAAEMLAFQELIDFFKESIKDKVAYGLGYKSLKFDVNKEGEMANWDEFEEHKLPVKILGDNDGSVKITKKRDMTKLAKHIRQKFHHVRDLYEQGALEPMYVNTKDQIADVLTKGLLPKGHLAICRKFMYLPRRATEEDLDELRKNSLLTLKVADTINEFGQRGSVATSA